MRWVRRIAGWGALALFGFPLLCMAIVTLVTETTSCVVVQPGPSPCVALGVDWGVLLNILSFHAGWGIFFWWPFAAVVLAVWGAIEGVRLILRRAR